MPKPEIRTIWEKTKHLSGKVKCIQRKWINHLKYQYEG